SGSLGATVRWTRPLTGTFTSSDGHTVQADSWISDKSKNVTRVTLTGPRADSSQISSRNPGSLTRPFLPQTFELVGRDSSGNEVRYGFVLRQWFVNRGNQLKRYSDQLAWCRSLGYRMPRVRDLTNAKCGVNIDFSCINGIDGASPNSSGNHYKRHIGAGFFTEWGSLPQYVDANYGDRSWTSDATGSTQFNVSSFRGGAFSDSSSNYAVCTAP
ncbi:MAG: hypothetical protein J6563_04965, partial [Gilliamella sp.]|uniref:hypothetical protein n=1 Tax=Gilliamella sp. TaxID=1891236 RepID=UPI002623CB86